MKRMEEIMDTIHTDNNHFKINILEEIEIVKAATSHNIVNEIINSRNDPLYKLFPSEHKTISYQQKRILTLIMF